MNKKIRPHTYYGHKYQIKGGTLFGVLLGLVLATLLAGTAVWFLYAAPTPFVDKQGSGAKSGQAGSPALQGVPSGTNPVPPAQPLALPGKPGDIPPEKRFQFYDILAGKKEAVPDAANTNKASNAQAGNGMGGMAATNTSNKASNKDKESNSPENSNKENNNNEIAAKEAAAKEAAAKEAKEKAAKEAKEKAAKEAKEKAAKEAKEAKEKEAAAKEKEAAAREGNKPPSRFYLQAGSFSKLHEADNQKARLALLGIASSVQPVAIDDRTLYRVRLGPFNRMEEASRVRSELAISGIEANLVKPKE